MGLGDKSVKREAFCDEIILKDMKIIIDMLVGLVSSYRLEVGAADELNRIALAHRHDVEEAIDRADDLGDIIDDMQDELKRLMKAFLKEVNLKISSKAENCMAQGYLEQIEKAADEVPAAPVISEIID